MKNYWLGKSEEKPVENKFEALTETLSNYGEQELALYIIDKYKSNVEFRDNIKIALWDGSDGSSSSSGSYTVGTDLSCECEECTIVSQSFPKSDESSIQAGCCYNDAPCNCTANLDIFYNHQFIQNETVKPSALPSLLENGSRHVSPEYVVEYKLDKNKVLDRSATGTVYVNVYAVQTFIARECGNLTFQTIKSSIFPNGVSDFLVVAGKMDCVNGVVSLIWNGVPMSTSLCMSYDYSIE